MKRQTVLLLICLLFFGGLLLATGLVSAKTTKNKFNRAGTILVQGAPSHGANGIMFDSNDQLHIASVLGREIIVMNPKHGKILARLGTDVGVEGPDDLTFGPDGSLYWTSIITGEVGRLQPDGTLTKQFVAPGVNPITFSDSGRLFVALDFLGDALYELDPNLVGSPSLLLSDLGFLNGMDFGPDGLLYGPIFTQGRIVQINVDLDPPTVVTVADGFLVPAAVKFDSRGRLHVVDGASGEVVRVNLKNGRKRVLATLLPGLDNLAFDSRDRLFVSSFGDGFIAQVRRRRCPRIISKGGLIAPGGVAVLPGPRGRDSVFVADFFSLREFDGRSGKARSVERHTFLPGQVTIPSTVAADGGNLLITSWFDNAVQVWNPDGREIVEDYRDFNVPLNAIRFQGDLVVAELGLAPGLARVVRDTAGVRVTLADAANGIVVPAGLASSGDDLWVSDWAAGTVVRIVAPGTVELVAEGLAFPEGLAVDTDGNLLVVESGAKRLLRINVTTKEVDVLVEGLEIGGEAIPGTPPTKIFNDVAVSSSGAIYVSGELINVLYRFKSKHRCRR